MPPTVSFSVLLLQRSWRWLAAGAMVLATVAALWRQVHPGAVFGAVVASLQLAGAAALWVRGRRVAWPVLAGFGALAACLAVPRAAPAVSALARLAVYASLLGLFARSLRPGHQPVVTGLARRIHPMLTPARIAYTRSVTRIWAVFFAAQILLWTSLLVLTPFRAEPWFAAWADLPLLAALLAGERAVRAVKFRGQPHGTLGDMLRVAGRRL